MSHTISGIHHITAISADAHKNLSFYRDVLGLRLVKVTVNFDDPGSYHLYYGDELGRPGTIMTFFVWPGARAGRIGPPQVTSTAFAVPAESLQYWSARLDARGVRTLAMVERFGERVLTFTDPDGLRLELVGLSNPGGSPWKSGGIPMEHAIRGFAGVGISEEACEATDELLTEVMGFSSGEADGPRRRYRIGSGGLGSVVDLLCAPSPSKGTMGAGVIHHVAFRAPDDTQQDQWQQQLADLGYNVTPKIDRNYFHSIYYREPGGVLFEIATDAPGFTVDEEPGRLGTALKLPAHLERYRTEIEQVLPSL